MDAGAGDDREVCHLGIEDWDDGLPCVEDFSREVSVEVWECDVTGAWALVLSIVDDWEL